ncbi:MAG: hypothetical protein HRU12_03790 [Phaeodactylibacter sp.]|nr:hypothetical protein [Phaeodactylibacter sp.]
MIEGKAEEVVVNQTGRFAKCERVIQRNVDKVKGLQAQIEESYIELGAALKEIRDKAFYQEAGYSSFEEYCKEKWRVGKSQANRYIQGSNIADDIINAHGRSEVFALPRSERQIRPLSKVAPDERGEVWKTITEEYKPEQITSKIVEREVELHIQAKPRKERAKGYTKRGSIHQEVSTQELEQFELSPVWFDDLAEAMENIRTHRWIFEMGFRTEGDNFNREGYNRLGQYWGIKFLATAIGANIGLNKRGLPKTGPDMLIDIVSSDLFSCIELGMRGCFSLKDVQYCVSIDEMPLFTEYFGIDEPDAFSEKKAALAVFHKLRELEKEYAN